MKRLYTFIFLIIFSSETYCQNDWSFVFGLNYSNFYDHEKSEGLFGFLFGFEKEWGLAKDLNLDLKLQFAIKGSSLGENIIGPYGPSEQRIYSYNITARVGYLEFPLTIKYSFLKRSKWSISSIVGYYIAFPISDMSNKEQANYQFTYDYRDPEHRQYEFDYYPMDVSSFGFLNEDAQINHGMIIGVAYETNIYKIELIYNRDFMELGYIDRISKIHNKLHSLSLIFGINI